MGNKIFSLVGCFTFFIAAILSDMDVISLSVLTALCLIAFVFIVIGVEDLMSWVEELEDEEEWDE